MSDLQPEKLHVTFQQGTDPRPAQFSLPRRYTLTHSDRTGDLFLTIGADYDRKQIAGLYTRLMRDEILAEWAQNGQGLGMNIYCHVSGGFAFGTARWRNGILLHHMRTVIEALCYGDHELISRHPALEDAKVQVHFESNQPRYNRVEDWGRIQIYHRPVG
jgi:hypothetical protein